MKGISTIIGALIVLIITITLGGLAYTYITSTTTSKIATVLDIDPSTTVCDGSTDTITIGLKNSGSNAINEKDITITGTKPDGTAITSTPCSPSTSTEKINAGGSGTCENTVAGGTGTNTVRVSGGGASAQGIVSCS